MGQAALMAVWAALLLAPAPGALQASAGGSRADVQGLAASLEGVLGSRPIIVQPSPVLPLPPPASLPSGPDADDDAETQAAGPAFVAPPDAVPQSRSAANGPAGEAPRPVGMEPDGGEPFFGTWVRPLGLRGSLSAGWGGGTSVYNGQPDVDASGSQWGAELSGAVALLDPRIVSLDYSAGIRHTGDGSITPAVESRSSVRATEVGLGANILSGRSMPLRVFFGRTSAGYDSGVTPTDLPEVLQDSRAVNSSVGASWNLNVPGLPAVHVSASRFAGSQVWDPLFGQSQWTTQRLAEVRATDSRPRLGYDLSYRFDDYDLDIPAAGLLSRTTQQMLRGAVRFEPNAQWLVNLDGRANRYALGANGRNGETTGTGVDASVRFAPTSRVFASARYALSTNLYEALLSGALPPGQIEAPVAPGTSLSNRVSADDFEGRVGYVRRSASVEVFAHAFSLGVPEFGPATLSRQRTAGATFRAQGMIAGFQVSGSVEGEAGTAFSSRGTSEPYQAGGGQLSMSRHAGRMLRFTLDGAARQASRLSFYVVPLAARSAGVRVEALRPLWARLSASVRRSTLVRDVIYTDYNDRFTAWSAAVTGARYGLTFDVNDADAHSLLLSPDILGRRQDLALLLETRPSLVGAFMASASRSRRVTARVEPWRRLQVQAFVQREERQNFGLYDQRVEGAQVSVVYALRQVQLEAGWNRYLMFSSLAAGTYENQRYFVRIRRDIGMF